MGMNDNVERLKMLKTDLERLERDHREILDREGTIARPVHQAADEARRRYKHVTEGNAKP